ncbi:MAG: phosphonate C-P lyase system protein PhnH [Phenylobacterium sp.]|uniref:phosphonate C-P lyase system protein PhnH n=1 Tax=Phenylobacterium sp. TaxID=1871053 RepID=UPI0039188B1C
MTTLDTPALDLAQVRPAFSDPMRDSQSVFRKVMEAVARPGTIADLSGAVEPPAGLEVASAAVALTLFDFETPVWIDPSLAGGETATWLRFHCGCPLTADTANAAFAVATDMAKAPPLSAFNQGDAKYPDRSTTLVLQVAALQGGRPVVLRGPGVKDQITVAPAGLPDGFWDQFETNTAQFQFGVDVLLVAGASLTALPRSVRVEIQGG